MEVFTVHRKYAHKERELIIFTKHAKNENTYTFILLSGYQAYEK